MYDVGDRGRQLDDALELAAPINHGAAAPAVAGAWTALEVLLFQPSDDTDRSDGRAIAADRMASLVAAAWPRSEMTTLSYQHKPDTPDRLSAELAGAATNRDRSTLVSNALAAGRLLALKAPTDIAASERMRQLLQAPRRELKDVQRHLRVTMRRLYRQRNLLLHGGAVGAVALDAALRTAAPLIGAGLDRITHGVLVDGVDPLMLASKAQLQLTLVGGDDGRPVTHLLD
jgi:hypothetical protein